MGQELRQLWNVYTDRKLTSRTNVDDLMSTIVSILIQKYDSPEPSTAELPYDVFFPSSLPVSTEGHPASFVIEIVSYFLHELKDPEKHAQVNAQETEDGASDDETDIPSHVSIKRYCRINAGESDEELPLRRQKLLNLFRAVSILVRWPHNCAVIRHTFDAVFAKSIISLAREFLVHLKLTIIHIEAPSSQADLQDVSHDDTVQFIIRCLFFIMHIILNALAIQSLDFTDFLPLQPLSQSVLEKLITPDAKFDKVVVDHEPHYVRILSSTVPQLKKMKSEYLYSFIYAGCLKFSMEIIQTVVELYPILTKPDSIITRQTRIALGTLEIEALFGIVSMCMTQGEMVPAELVLFEPVKQTFDMVQSGLYYNQDALFIRKMLLCLRINSWLLSKLKSIKPDAAHLSHRLLPSSLIASFFRYLSTKFDYERQEEDWITKMARSKEYGVHVSIDLKLQGVRSNHDLWPWTNTPQYEDEEKGHEITEFHLFKKEMFGNIQRSIKALAGYTIWESVLSEILGSYMLMNARNNSNVTSKVNKDNLRYVYEIFDAFFRARQFSQVEVDSSKGITESSADVSSLWIPLSQLKFVEFISQLFKAADASNIFSIISEFETFRFLLGEKFLLAHNTFASYPSTIFEQIEVVRNSDGMLEVYMSKILDPRFECLYVWFYLESCVIDYFHGLVIYSLYFQTGHQDVQAFLSYEDILLVLTQYLLSLSKNNHFPGHIVFQISSVIINLNDIVLSMAFHNSKTYLLDMVQNVMEVLDNQLRGKFRFSDEQSAVFELIGCYSVTQLLFHLIAPCGEFSSKDIFLTTSTNTAPSALHASNNTYNMCDMANEICISTSKLDRSPSASLRKETRFSSDGTMTSHASISISKPLIDLGDKGVKIRSSLIIIVTLLLSESFHLVGLALAQSIITSCAQAIDWLEKNGTSDPEERTKQKLQARILAAEVLSTLFQFVAVSYKHPNREFSLSSPRNCLESMTVLLRDVRLANLRIYIQDFIRRENLIYELLRSLAKCLNGHDVVRVRLDNENEEGSKADGNSHPRSVLCAGLACLSAIVAGNEACKNALRLLLNSSREKVGSARAKHAASLVDKKDKLNSTVSTALSLKSASGLVSLILCADKQPGQEVMVLMLDLLLDGRDAGVEFMFMKRRSNIFAPLFHQEDGKPTVKNTAVLQDFFQLIPYCDEKIQRFALDSFRNLICGKGSLVNLTVCANTRPKVFDIVLELFPYVPESIQSCNAELLDFLGRYVVTVSSMKHLFRILQRSDGNSPSYAWKVIQALQGMFMEDPTPKHTFVFDGVSSGLKLPSIYKWPKLRGFTFTCWLLVESPHNLNSDLVRYCPEVFSLRNEEGVGLELHLDYDSDKSVYSMYLMYANASKEVMRVSSLSNRMQNMELLEGKWYFLAVTLFAGNFYSKGEVKIVLNDIVHKEDIGTWSLPDVILEPMIGEVPANLRADHFHHTLRGQMGAVYFFHEALTEQQLSNIYSLGPDYIYNFEPYSAGYKELVPGSNSKSRRGNTSKGQNEQLSNKKSILDDGILTSKLMLAYNPAVLRGKYFLDNTPEKNEIYWKLPSNVEISSELRSEVPKTCLMHAARLPGTYRSATQDVRLAINSLGGIKVIIPLFAQLKKQQVTSHEGEENVKDSSILLANDAAQLNSNFFPAILGLFTTLLEDNEENRRIFHKAGGFALIAVFLEDADSSCFNLITLNQFVAIFENLKDDTVLMETCFDCILCNFRLWSRATVEVQVCWLDWLINAISALQLTSVSLYSSQRFVDTFYYHYDYQQLNLTVNNENNSTPRKEIPSVASIDESISESVNGGVILNRLLNDEEVAQIRSKIYMCVRVTIVKGYSAPHEAIVMLLRYLSTTVDMRAKVETLQFVIVLLLAFEHTYPDKLVGLLFGCSLSDSMICVESGLKYNVHQHRVWYATTLQYFKVICYLFSVHQGELSSYQSTITTNAPVAALNISLSVAYAFSSPLKSVSSEDTLNQLNRPEPASTSTTDFTELCSMPLVITKLCQIVTALHLARTENDEDLLMFTCTQLVQIMISFYHSSTNIEDITLPFDNFELSYPVVFPALCSLLKLVESNRSYCQIILGILVNLLNTNTLRHLCVCDVRFEDEVSSLLCSVLVKASVSTDEVTNGCVQLTMRIVIALVRCSLFPVAFLSTAQPPSVTGADYAVNISIGKRIFAALAQSNSIQVLMVQNVFFSVLLTALFNTIYRATPAHVSIATNQEAACVCAVGYALISLICQTSSIMVSNESTMTNLGDLQNVLLSMLLQHYPGTHTFLGAFLGRVFEEHNSVKALYNLVLVFTKLYLQPYQALLGAKAVEDFDSFLSSLSTQWSNLYKCIELPGAIPSVDEKKVMKSKMPLVFLRLLYELHALLKCHSNYSDSTVTVILPLYQGLHTRMQAMQHDYLTYEKVYHVFMAQHLGMLENRYTEQQIDSVRVELNDIMRCVSNSEESNPLEIVCAMFGGHLLHRGMHYADSSKDALKTTSHELTEEELATLAKKEITFPSDSVDSPQSQWQKGFALLATYGSIIFEETPSTLYPRHKGSPSVVLRKHRALSITTNKPSNAHVLDYIIQAETVRVYETLRSHKHNLRRCEVKKTRLLSQLANERGPWGYGSEHKREVYWTIDGVETNFHTQIRLRRNLLGTRHTIATLKSIGKTIQDEQSANSNFMLSSIDMDMKKYTAVTKRKLKAEGAGADEDDNTNLSDGEDEHETSAELATESESLSVSVEVISAATNSSGGKTIGRLDISRHKLSFSRQTESEEYDFVNKTGNHEFLWACSACPSTTWSSADIAGVYRRHYQLRYVALEVFFVNRTSLFLNLIESKAALRVYNYIVKRMKTPNLCMIFTGRPWNAINRVFTSNGLTVTQAWAARKISNFDYLMYLNFIAGRTFNDLAQYPVFPWVLADYTSSKLDLRDPSIYRKFDRPMGAQSDTQREILMEKYRSSLSMQDDGFYPYHCGSHYSTAAMVIWYLLRMEPFTSYHVWLQDGKFDRPDRLFHSIASTFSGCTTNTQDVKELIPEFFYNPEFLSNLNQLQLGTRQDGDALDDVILPKWARDPVDFVRIHREALESEHVSSQLHHWIDLVFGCKQRPPFLPNGSEKTVQACNVFYHLSYLGAVDLDDIKSSDPDLYERTVRQIDNYGQTPCQLFTKEHPRRKSLLEVQDILWPIGSVVLGAESIDPQESSIERPKRLLCYGECKVSNFPVLFIADCTSQERLITIDSNRILGYHVFQMRNPSHVPPFSMKLDKVAFNQATANKAGFSSYLPYSNVAREKVVGIPFASPVVLNPSFIENLGMYAQNNSKIAELLGTKENKTSYIDEEMKTRTRILDDASASFSKQRVGMVKSTSSTSLKSVSRRLSSNSIMKESKSSLPRVKEGSEQVSKMPGSGAGDEGDSNQSHNATTTTTITTAATSTTNNNALPGGKASKVDKADYHLSAHLFCYLPAMKLVFSCGHWDNAFKATAADTGKLVQSISHHREVVTCISCATDYNKHYLATGSKDCTVTIWEVVERESEPVHIPPLHTLYGHDDAVNCVVIQTELDLVVSGSDDGTIMIHSLREGIYIRSIVLGAMSDSLPASPSFGTLSRRMTITQETPPSAGSSPSGTRHLHQHQLQQHHYQPQHLERVVCRVHLLAVTRDGNIVAYSNDGFMLGSYTLNGRCLRLLPARERLHALCLSEDGRTVLTGGERGLVVIRWVYNLAIANNGARRGLEAVCDGSNAPDFEPFGCAIRSLALTANERHLLVGLDSGDLRVVAQVSNSALFYFITEAVLDVMCVYV
ncbi:DUF4704 domain-containing protein [archaeon]|nr:MAG: DUF4704 domain-containing protein [archaeon]